MDSFEILEWDTNFFGIKVAKIIPSQLRTEALNKVLTELREADVKVAYWASDPSDPETQEAAKKAGGFLADEKVTFAADLANLSSIKIPDVEATPFQNTKATPELLELAVAAGEFSRFKVDPNFSEEQFQQLYHAWIENSLAPESTAEVFVIDSQGKAEAMLIVSEKSARSSVDLIAVGEQSRGKGYGKALMSAAHRWGKTRGLKSAQVVTQLQNSAACALYHSCGYQQESVVNVFHFWLT